MRIPNGGSILALVVVAATTTTSTTTATPTRTAFVVPSLATSKSRSCRSVAGTRVAAASDEDTAAAAATTEAEEADVSLDVVESLGRGSAKAKRGKRKGVPVASNAPSESESTALKSDANLPPEETFYEGPPAITETIAPTVSILTVVGIVPAVASWARQAWVRYTITNRRIRVVSGLGGKDEAEIVYGDIVELRTAKRLFGDGDLVATLRDGAKFEMRHVPNFEETVEFILAQNLPEETKEKYARFKKGEM